MVILFNILEGGGPSPNPDPRSNYRGVGSGNAPRYTLDTAFEVLPGHTQRLHAEGILGEELTKRVLQEKGFRAVSTNGEDPYYPIDALALDDAGKKGWGIEIKTNDIASKDHAWRIQVGGAAFQSRLALLGEHADRSATLKTMESAVLRRKFTQVAKFQNEYKEYTIKPAMFGVKVDFKTREAQVYQIDGFNKYVGWNDPKVHYFGSTVYNDDDLNFSINKTKQFYHLHEGYITETSLRILSDFRKWLDKSDEVFQRMLTELKFLQESKRKKKKLNHLTRQPFDMVKLNDIGGLTNILNHF